MNPHNHILSLARAGNPVRAWERFGALGLDAATDDIKALTLKGRLLKDLAGRAEGNERLRLYLEASRAYLAANALRTDSYPLINAATLALLSQDRAQAEALARQVIALIEADPDEGETPYWREATRAEALLLLGQERAAEQAFAQGIARLPRAWEDHAATIGQFERILAAQGADAGWLDRYRPAAAVHFSGLIAMDPEDTAMLAALDRAIADIGPGFAFGALAAGADIVLAERLIAAGATLHVVLPFGRERFCELSVEPYGAHWGARFDALIDAAETVEELWDGNGDAADWLAALVDAGNLAAMGRCLRRAGTLRSSAHAIAIAARREALRGHIAAWQAAGQRTQVIETERSGAVPRIAPAQPIGSIPAVLAVQAADAELIATVAAAHGLRVPGGAGPRQLNGGASACLAALAELRGQGEMAAAALVVCPVETPSAHTSAGALAARLVQVAGECELYADHNSAMIARVLDPGCRVEDMGEVGTLGGPVPVCAIALR
jgi:hypothetical protein